MKLLKAFGLKSLAVAALFAFAPLSSNATAYLIAEWASGNSGDAAEIQAVKDAIAAFNTQGNFPAPIPELNTSLVFQAKTTDTGDYEGSDDKSVVWTAPSGDVDFYVLTKWGQGQADFDTALHFVTAGNTLNYDPKWGGSKQPDAPNGLSHIWIWHTEPGTNVPDGGATAALLGLGILGLAAVRRKQS